MDSDNRSTTFQTSGLKSQKKRKPRKRGKQRQTSEDVESEASELNFIEGDVLDNAGSDENVEFITNKCELDDSPRVVSNTNENMEYFETTVDALGVQNSIEIKPPQRQTSQSDNGNLTDQEYLKRINLISDNNKTIFTDGISLSCVKQSENYSNAPEKVINELDSEDVEKLYPSTSATTAPEVVQLYNSNALPKQAKTYELEKFARNVLIIFNQKTFATSIRKGTEKDVKALTDTFEALNFDVLPYTDRTLTQINQILEAVSVQDFTDYGCIAIAVLTHGGLDGEIWAKDDSYNEMEIINCLKTHKNYSLITKPRLLIVQACRGPNALLGVPVLQRGKTRTDLHYDTTPYTLPVEADMLVLHSSYAGNQAHRDELDGTWFIQTLCKKINEMATTHDLESILIDVKHEVAIDREHKVHNRVTDDIDINKQMPVVTSTLIRKLYLKKYGDEADYAASVMNEMCANISVDTANVGANPESCWCALNYFDYIKDCLRHHVNDNSGDSTAQSLLILTETFRNEESFDSAKKKCAIVIADHLEKKKAKDSEYYKYLHIIKGFQ